MLIPIYENKNGYYIVLTKRTQDVMYHKGQISFPGGAYDKDDGDLTATALREAFEEIGVRTEDVEILGNLDDQSTYTSRFVITPFVGAIPYPYKFKVSRKEVEELIEVPVSALLKPGCFSPETQDEEGKSLSLGTLCLWQSQNHRNHRQNIEAASRLGFHQLSKSCRNLNKADTTARRLTSGRRGE